MTAPASHFAFNPNHLDDSTIIRALAEGEHRPVLQAFFGPTFTELSVLARQALTVRVDASAPPVYVLPGLLGSKLGTGANHHSGLLWLDPAAVIAGKLSQLAIGKRRSLRATGVMLPGYLKLMLSLQAAGLRITVHAYDWRRGIRELGKQFAERLLQDSSDEVMLVAHSMGGLIARAALKYAGGGKVTRLVQLGPPNQGSFALVQVLRGCYPTVRKLGAIDQTHSAEGLTQQVFRSFHSFYEMLPQLSAGSGLNLFDARDWPQDSLTPPGERLKLGRRLARHLAHADRRCHVIAGVDQMTVCGVRRQGDEFVFQARRAGDGTVPLSLANWRGAQHWHVREAHGALPRNSSVCQATIDLLRGETTQVLSPDCPAEQQTLVETSETELRAVLNGKVRWEQLPLHERRDLLEPVVSPTFRALCTRDDEPQKPG